MTTANFNKVDLQNLKDPDPGSGSEIRDPDPVFFKTGIRFRIRSETDRIRNTGPIPALISGGQCPPPKKKQPTFNCQKIQKGINQEIYLTGYVHFIWTIIVFQSKVASWLDLFLGFCALYYICVLPELHWFRSCSSHPYVIAVTVGMVVKDKNYLFFEFAHLASICCSFFI